LEVHSGFRERAVALIHAIYEIGLARILGAKNDLMPTYETYWDNEYPRIGEMQRYRGFIDYLRLRETNEEEIILVRAKDDFLIDESPEIELATSQVLAQWLAKEKSSYVNWRPRRTSIDPDYIDANPESVVFFSDIKEAVSLFEVTTINDLHTALDIFLDVLELRVFAKDSDLVHQCLPSLVAAYPEYLHF